MKDPFLTLERLALKVDKQDKRIFKLEKLVDKQRALLIEWMYGEND